MRAKVGVPASVWSKSSIGLTRIVDKLTQDYFLSTKLFLRGFIDIMAKLARIALKPGGPAQWAVQQGQDLLGLGDSVPAGDHDTAWLQLAAEGVPASLMARAQRLDPAKV